MTAPYLELEIYWEQPIPFDVSELDPLQAVVMPLGGIIIGNIGGSGGAVDSVNGQTGEVVLTAADVGADPAGAAQAVSEALQPQITLNTEQLAFLTALLAALQSAKADVTYVNQQIATLVGTDAQMLATIQAIANGLAEYEDLLSALDQTVANRVRFDVATQGLTALQKYNARTNIGAEEAGTAALLIGQITATSIGAVTTAQLANVAFSGSYNDLSNKPSITGALLTGLTSVSAAAISATDTIVGALAKLQANIDTKADAANTLTLINQKVSSVLLGAANGVATLGSDGLLTAAQRPASSGGGTSLTWVDLTLAAGNNFASGFADGSNKLQIAKDASGYIWMRGVIRNLLTSGNNGSTILVFPTVYRLRLASNTAGVDSLLPVPVVNLNAKGTTGPIFLSPYTYDTSTQWLSSGYGAVGANAVLFMPPTVVGIALNP